MWETKIPIETLVFFKRQIIYIDLILFYALEWGNAFGFANTVL